MSTRRTVYLLTIDLDPATTRGVKEAVYAFPSEIAALVRGADIDVQPAPQWMADFVRENDAIDIAVLNGRLFEATFAHGCEGAKVFVGCDPCHPLACSARANNKDALWGAAFRDSTLALVYGKLDDEFAMWHELLHLYNAGECYELPDRGPTCTNRRCIMQYEPTADRTGPGIEICEANLHLVRKRLVGQ